VDLIAQHPGAAIARMAALSPAPTGEYADTHDSGYEQRLRACRGENYDFASVIGAGKSWVSRTMLRSVMAFRSRPLPE
jgi:hypothetical protein